MPLKKYRYDNFYNIRERICASTFVLGKDTWLWIAKTKEPESITISCDSLSVNDETIIITADKDCTLYKYDVLPFLSSLVVISETTQIKANIATNLEILPSEIEITSTEQTCTLALIPVMFVANGGSLEFNANEAEALNKAQMFPAKRTVSRTSESSVEGNILLEEDSLDYLYTLNLRSRTIYCETRYSPFVNDRGMGLGAWCFQAVTSISANWSQDEFIKATATFMVTGRPHPYDILACQNPCFGDDWISPAPPNTELPLIMEIEIDLALASGNGGLDYSLYVAEVPQDFVVFWGDGSSSVVTNGNSVNLDHFYSSVDKYRIEIRGNSMVGFGFFGDGDLRGKTLRVLRWDDSRFTLGEEAFRDLPNFTAVPINYTAPANFSFENLFRDCPNFAANLSQWNVSSVISLQNTFKNCNSFSSDLSNWDISNVTSLCETFEDCKVFNSPLNTWDTSNVVDMQQTFDGCEKFNQPLDNWDTSNVLTMELMFRDCKIFNQNLNNWNVSKVANFNRIFQDCHKFNQPLDNWDISAATELIDIFFGCHDFNQTVDTWDVSNKGTLIGVFNGCHSFNQPLTNWFTTPHAVNLFAFLDNTYNFNQDISHFQVQNVTDMGNMLNNSGLSVTNYSNFLIACDSQSVQSNVDLDAGGLFYNSAGQTARNNLTSEDNWDILDSGLAS